QPMELVRFDMKDLRRQLAAALLREFFNVAGAHAAVFHFEADLADGVARRGVGLGRRLRRRDRRGGQYCEKNDRSIHGNPLLIKSAFPSVVPAPPAPSASAGKARWRADRAQSHRAYGFVWSAAPRRKSG